MKATKINKILGSVLTMAFLGLSGITFATDGFDFKQNVTAAKAEEKNYEVTGLDYMPILTLKGDCSLDLNDDEFINDAHKGYMYDLIIDLNGYTLTILDSFECWKGFDLEISNGTIIFEKNDVMCEAWQDVKLDNVTFKAKCQCLFEIYHDHTYYNKIFTVTNCNFIDCEFSDSEGGAFYINEDAEIPLIFSNNYFYNCESKGSLIYIDDLWADTISSTNRAPFNMSGNRFYKCKNANGCIYINTPYVDIGALDDNSFLNSIDSCEATGCAAAIYDDDGDSKIKGFVCTNNFCNGEYGGAMYIGSDDTKIEDCYFINNKATNKGNITSGCKGGAIYLAYEGDHISIQNCYFAENKAYKGGAIYNNDSTNSFTNCYFALDTADCGTSDAIYSPSKVTNSHFYHDDPFEKDWSNYYDKTGLVDASSTNNANGSFLEVVKGEEIVSGKYYLIKNEASVYFLYVCLNLGINKFIGSYNYRIAQEYLIWFEPFSNFSGIIDGNNRNVFIQGENKKIVSSGEAKYYIASNHNSTTRYDTLESINYYTFNEDTMSFEQTSSKVDYLSTFAGSYSIYSGTYYVNYDLTIPERIDIKGDVTLILHSGATLTAEKGIRLTEGNSLTLTTITTDRNQAGKLIAKGTGNNAAIGGNAGENDSHGEACGTFNDYGILLEITSAATGIGGGNAGKAETESTDGFYGGNGGDVKIYSTIATITSAGTGIGGGQGGQKNGSGTHGSGGKGGTLTVYNSTLDITSTSSIGIGGGRGYYEDEKEFGEDGIGTELSINGGITKVYSGYGKAVCAYLKDVANYQEQTLDFITDTFLARYGSDKDNFSPYGSYKIKDYAFAKCVEIGKHIHTLVTTSGHSLQCSECGKIYDFDSKISLSLNNSKSELTIKLNGDVTSESIFPDSIQIGEEKIIDTEKLVIDLNNRRWTITGDVTTGTGFKNIEIKNGHMTFTNPNLAAFTIDDGLQVNNVVFENCTAGRLFKITSSLNESDSLPFEVKNCKFVDCSFKENGGVFYFDQTVNKTYYRAKYSIENCYFDNISTAKDGSIFYVNKLKNNTSITTLPTILNVQDCVFLNCHADGNGGVAYFNDGVWFGNYYNLNEDNTTKNYDDVERFIEGPTIVANIFSNCSAKNGGVIYSNSTNTYIGLCFFINNSASTNGNALFLNEATNIDYCIFYRNNAHDGAGIYAETNQYKINHYHLFMDKYNIHGQSKYEIDYESQYGGYYQTEAVFDSAYDIPNFTPGSKDRPYYINNSLDLLHLAIHCYREANGLADTSYRTAYYNFKNSMEAITPLEYFEGAFVDLTTLYPTITNQFKGGLVPSPYQLDNRIRVVDINSIQQAPVVFHEKSYSCRWGSHDEYYEVGGKYYSDAELLHEITDLNAWSSPGGAGYVSARHEDKDLNGFCDFCNRQYGFYFTIDHPYSNHMKMVDYWGPNGYGKGIFTDDTITEISPGWYGGWYFALNDIEFKERVTINGTVRIVVDKNKTVIFSKGIFLAEGSSLTIYATTGNIDEMGKVYFYSTTEDAAIGTDFSDSPKNCGSLTINGCKVYVYSTSSVAFGGGNGDNCQGGNGGTLNVQYGFVELQGAYVVGGGAGISRGGNTNLITGSTMKIYTQDDQLVKENSLCNNLTYVKVCHVHNGFKYSVNGNTINATCYFDEFTTSITPSISETIIYDGKPKGVEIPNLDDFLEVTGLEEISIEYYKDDVLLDSIPTDIGNYTVVVSVMDLEVTLNFEIIKASVSGYENEITVLLTPKENEQLAINLPSIPDGFSYGKVINNNPSLYSLSSIEDGVITITTLKRFIISGQTSFTIEVNSNNPNIYGYSITVNVVPNGHTHGQWTYQVIGDTIIATCNKDDCEEKFTVSLTLSASGGVYDGETPFTATHDDEVSLFSLITEATLGEIKYYDADGNLLPSAPVNAGVYTAKLTITGMGSYTISKRLIIQKADYDMSNAKWDYEEPFSFDTSEKEVLVIGLPNGVSVDEYTNNKATYVGEYTASVKFIYDSDNYNEISLADLVWKINKAQIVKPLENTTNFVYNAEEQTYTLTENSVYTISNNTKTNVGVYEVTVKLNDTLNYEWADGSITDLTYIFTISPKPIEVTITNKTSIYGESIVALSATDDGIVDGDTNVYSLSVTIDSKSPVGTYDIVGTALDDNYAITFVNESNAYAITPRTVTLTWGETTFTYDKTSKLPTVTVGNLVNDDEVTSTVISDKESINQGDYLATVTALSNANYKLPEIKSTAFVINPLAINVTITNKTSIYGDSIVALSATDDGIVDGDTNVYSLSVTIDSTSPVGTYDIVGTALDDNYAITFVNESDSYTITPRTVTLTWSETTLIYDKTTKLPTVTVGNLVNDDEITSTVVSDKESINQGSYLATVTALSNANYKLPENKSTAFVINPLAINVTITNKTSIYGDSIVALSATDDGIINGDTNVYSLSVIIDSTSPVGTYDIVGTALDDNYAITFVNESNAYTITPRTVTLTWSETTLIYDKTTRLPTVTVGNLVNADEVTAVVTSDKESVNPGNYVATITTLSNSNYKLPEDKSSNFEIIPSSITITITNKTSVYGENAELTSEITNGTLYDGDDLHIVLTKAPGNDVGEYEITGSYNNSNYTVTFVNGTYTITTKDIVLSIVDVESGTFTYDGLAKTTIATYEGLLDDNELSYVLAYSDNINAGNCGVSIHSATITKGNAKNYNLIISDKGVLVIDKATQSITNISDISKIYDGTEVSLPTYTKLGDGQATVKYKTINSDEYLLDAPKDIGNYIVVIIVGEGTNYLAGSQEVRFSINQRAIDVIVKDASGNEISNPPATIVDAENGLEPNAEFVVSTHTSEDEEKMAAIENLLTDKLDNQKVLAVYDLKIMVENVEKQPNGEITIRIKVPEKVLGKKFVIFHIHSETDIQVLDNLTVDENGFVTITTDKLSEFAFAVKNGPKMNPLTIILIAGSAIAVIAVVTTVVCVSIKKKKKLSK